MGVPTTTVGTYDAALQRRQALMGASGARALVKNFKVFRIAAFACIGGILYGYNQGMFSGILVMPAFERHMGDYVANPTKKGWLTSILELGAWFGTLMSGAIAELCSRKYGILIATSVFIVGVVVQATAIQAGYQVILAGRFITGCHFIGGTGDTQSDAAWLIPICLQLAPAFILFAGMAWMPFSPRWLAHHNREEEARQVLADLRDLPTDHELIELEFLEIKAQSLFEKRSLAEKFPHLQAQTAANTFKLQFVAIGSLFKTKAMFKRVIVATVTMFFQQWTGINAVLYYAPQIFGQLGLSSNTTSLLATGVVGIVMFIATVPAVLWIDRLGRKPVLAVGAIGMGACHLIIAVILAKNINNFENNQAAGWGAICMVWLFVVHFGYSWGPCAWIIIAEIWPLSTRPYGTSLGASSNWMNNFIVGQVTPEMLEGITYGTYILFGLLTWIGAAFIWFVVPETKRLSLEEMDTIFGSEGTALADNERMAEINREIGLDNIIYRE
ncbi:Ff.00g078110.m01.CDS01 [Fusarium sp. VM40]|nr:Ff.00g078110.m01.CDS01 [Fusarium sp. VM40]